ncbi:hypothetical protein [Nonomuraea sp. LPB2021202275-12-8]|uniref:hypothetical protein n=1 Tax=Nonomuraea sp. LPB2021202275-12-8 TaxID=3120159 RepID=UPI00300C2A3F
MTTKNSSTMANRSSSSGSSNHHWYGSGSRYSRSKATLRYRAARSSPIALLLHRRSQLQQQPDDHPPAANPRLDHPAGPSESLKSHQYLETEHQPVALILGLERPKKPS